MVIWRMNHHDQHFRPIAAALKLLTLTLLVLLCPPLQAAELTAVVDRNNISIDDTLNLDVVLQDSTDGEAPDLSQLKDDFDILSSQQSSQTQWINGQLSRRKTWRYIIAPKRLGQLEIPALEVSGYRSDPIRIKVKQSQSDHLSGKEDLFLDAEISSEQAYVQQQLVFTLRIYTAVHFSDAALDPLTIDNALIEAPTETRYNTIVGGRSYQVIERRFAVFPQSSGELNIPSLNFQAYVDGSRRSLLDRGRLVRKRSPSKTVTVKGPRSDFPGTTWLPAQALRIDEQWSQAPQELTVGDSVTRNLIIEAEGLLADQLPPLPLADVPGLKAYPDRAHTDNENQQLPVVGRRSQSIAYIADQAGRYTLPAIRLPWWDTSTDNLRWAEVPAREIVVKPLPGATQSQAPQAPAQTDRPPASPSEMSSPVQSMTEIPTRVDRSPVLWLIIAIQSLCIVVLSALLWRARHETPQTPVSNASYRPQSLVKLARHRSLPELRQGLIQWWCSHHPGARRPSLDQVTKDWPQLKDCLQAIAEAEYREGDSEPAWQELERLLKQPPKLSGDRMGRNDQALPPLHRHI